MRYSFTVPRRSRDSKHGNKIITDLRGRPEMNSPELLTVPESAAYVRYKPSTIRAWILNKKINYVKLGGKVFLRRCDLDSLIARSLVPAKLAVATVEATS
jgi:excisionase family DNA binding protein